MFPVSDKTSEKINKNNSCHKYWETKSKQHNQIYRSSVSEFVFCYIFLTIFLWRFVGVCLIKYINQNLGGIGVHWEYLIF